MKINIYYGGRGIIADPTLCVLNKIQEVLKELNVNVTRYDLFEYKNGIVSLPQTLQDADGVILATTVEWFGIGGWMTQFLDACWLYGDKEKLKSIYMCPIAMSTTYGEREALTNLTVAWETLGGLTVTGICGYIPEGTRFEEDKTYDRIIEKRTEDLYRSINQKYPVFPSSNQALKQKVSFTQGLILTQEEAATLSEYAADDVYVQKQKEDIQELTSLFSDLLEDAEEQECNQFLSDLREHFTPQPGFAAVYKFNILENDKPLIVKIDGLDMECFYGDEKDVNVEMQLSSDIMNEIISGRMTFQRAFMAGSMKMKGDFRVLRTLDMLYNFSKAS